MWSGARTERTMRAVHEQNLKYAEEAGMTIDEWHEMMSDKGSEQQKPIQTQRQEDGIIYNSAYFMLQRMFPTINKKK